MKLIYTIVGTLIVLFIITFSLENTIPVNLSYYDFFEWTIPSYLLIFIFFGIGVIFAGFFGIVERFRLAGRNRQLSKKVRELEKNQAVIDVRANEETDTTNNQ